MNELSNQNHAVEIPAVANPFGNNALQTRQDVATAQVVSHEVAELQAQIYLAKQFPRNETLATDKILNNCQRESLAAVAVYSYVRGGTDISGPSIRLAEEIARNWGNLECGWQEMERDKDSSKIRAFAWDKESNILKKIDFVVPHFRTTRNGTKRITDERDLYELLANQAARRMRNCILALIPGDVIEAAVEQCHKTMVTTCDINPESLRKLVQAFEEFNVTKKQIEKRIQRHLESITPAQFVRMREIYTSLRDGMSEPSDWFDMDEAEEAPSATENLKNALKTAKPAQKTTKARKPVNTPNEDGTPEKAETTSENPSDDVSPRDEFLRDIYEATNESELTALLRRVQGSTLLTDAEKFDLSSVIDDRVQQMRIDAQGGLL